MRDPIEPGQQGASEGNAQQEGKFAKRQSGNKTHGET